VESSPADDGAAQGEEGFVDVVADLPADAQTAEPVQQRERGFGDPAEDAESGAVLGVRDLISGAPPAILLVMGEPDWSTLAIDHPDRGLSRAYATAEEAQRWMDHLAHGPLLAAVTFYIVVAES
jgi:hypothetical protein